MARAPRPAVVDFETEAIQRRPHYPPKPVGVSIKLPSDRRSRYYAWGHLMDNNCSREEAVAALRRAWACEDGVLFHNAKFDVDVAQTHLGLPLLPAEKVHDTLYLVFFDDPHASSFSLKPSAERLLGLAPEERDAVRDWLVSQKIVRPNQRDWGAHICRAPGGLVGLYADGDVLRTDKLFKLLYPKIVERGMLGAYVREQRLMPVLLRNEREGVCADVAALETDSVLYAEAKDAADAWLRKTLKTPELNVDSPDELADALDKAGKASDWVLTPNGKRSTSKENILLAVSDRRVTSVLLYRQKLSTCLDTFISTWLAQARETGGRIHTSWNQVRQTGSDATSAGARTGRTSSSPNFQNVPKTFKEKKGKYEHPAFVKGLPQLPSMRRYFLPDKNSVWCKRDYRQQELRVLGHYEDGALLRAYLEDRQLDVHALAAKLISEQFRLKVTRDDTKTIGFAILYGMGLGALAERMEIGVDDAKVLRSAYLGIFPGLEDLQKGLKAAAAENEPIRTWGGRLYLPEPKKMVKGRLRSFEYKLLNYLIQGSSADCTKEAMIRYDSARKHGRLLLQVHDEIDITAPTAAVKSEMKILSDAMASVEFDVPMLSDGSTGPNWNELKEFADA